MVDLAEWKDAVLEVEERRDGDHDGGTGEESVGAEESLTGEGRVFGPEDLKDIVERLCICVRHVGVLVGVGK